MAKTKQVVVDLAEERDERSGGGQSWAKTRSVAVLLPCYNEEVTIGDTVRGFQEIVEGKHDELPEQAFMYVGSVEEAAEQAGKLQVTP